nr:MAG TPA: hypothetical protein [Caudoviricetes sp.]
MTDEKKTEIANKIKNNMNNPKELEELLLNLSVEEWCFIKNNPTLRKIIENALDKDTIEKIEKKFERLLKAENLKKLSVTVYDDDDNDDNYLPV